MSQRIQHQRGEPDLSGIVFRNGEAGEHQEAQYRKFYQCFVTSTRYTDVNCLCELRLLDNVQCLLRNFDLTYVCILNHPTYESLTLEFFSSFPYNTHADENMYLTRTINFRMFNTEYSLNQEALSDFPTSLVEDKYTTKSLQRKIGCQQHSDYGII